MKTEEIFLRFGSTYATDDAKTDKNFLRSFEKLIFCKSFSLVNNVNVFKSMKNRIHLMKKIVETFLNGRTLLKFTEKWDR